MGKKTAIIIGAGPAGLTAACELLKRTDVHPIVLEATEDLGGIAKTVNSYRKPPAQPVRIHEALPFPAFYCLTG